MIEVYQAEWCPHSAVVRQRLTELMIDYVARQVPPEPEDRTELLARTAVDTIPVVVLEDGTILAGSDDEILAGIDARFPETPFAEAHRLMAAVH
jgi:glutaredoxin